VTTVPLVRVLASSSNWIDGAAVEQLRRTAELPGMRLAIGLPDLHPGKDSPVGAAYLVADRLYPALVGNDVGCGIGLWRTLLGDEKPRPEAWAKKLRGLEAAWDGDAARWLAERTVLPTPHDASLGTIGGGNHFAELQAIDSVPRPDLLTPLGLAAGDVCLLVHSGSRGFGDAILREHLSRFRSEGLPAAGSDAELYLAQHGHAVDWAVANRELIAHRLLARLYTSSRRVLDVCHNWVERIAADGGEGWLHRKGAAPSTQGPVVIPGSRGSFSYLVLPREAGDRSGWSVAHGAGRKWSRTDCKARLEKRYGPAQLRRTELGSHVICEDNDLLYEEAPQAYKKIDVVIDDLVAEGLIDVVAV